MAVRRIFTTIVAVGILGAAGMAGLAGQPPARVQPRPLRVLLLGDDREPHSSAGLYAVLAPALARRGIQVTRAVTADPVVDTERLAHYDAVLLYGDQASPGPGQEAALAAFVDSGKGIVAMHASAAPLGGGRLQASAGG